MIARSCFVALIAGILFIGWGRSPLAPHPRPATSQAPADGRLGSAPETPPEDRYRDHIEALQRRLPNDQFSIVVEAPFVVIGDEPPADVQRRADQTVAFAVRTLKQDFFKQDPEEILDIWLFRDQASYEQNCEELFGIQPRTPYGFYSRPHRALVMNIATGGGTLVHEIVHPFMERNFPQCPAWFNEGLASLYEQSAERDGQIVGLTNWRLRGLQSAIRTGKTRDFQSLCETSTREFYDDPTGVHYAQARYLCFALQERGVLRTFYHRFRQNVQSDPSGFQTLQEVLKTNDMNTFQKDWEQEILALRFAR